MLTPQGEVFDQAKAARLSEHRRLAFLCGRYEGVDERVREFLVTEEISIGDYVLTGGELPAMVVIDALARQIPGVLGDAEAAEKDSHAMGLLEYPHYTRPAEYRGWHVPEVLLSGNHANVDIWRRQEALKRTFFRRPDLLESLSLDAADKEFLKKLQESQQPPRDRDQNA
jgi:tRNA (guanine37-N1)-methyltransferase